MNCNIINFCDMDAMVYKTLKKFRAALYTIYGLILIIQPLCYLIWISAQSQHKPDGM